MTNILNKFNAMLPSSKSVFGYPIAGIYVIIAGLSLLFPIVILSLALSEGIVNCPVEIVLAFTAIYLVSSICMVWSSLIWWQGYKELVSELKESSRYIASIIFSSLSKMTNKWLVIAIALPGIVTLLSCAIVFNDIDYLSLFKEFELDFLITKKYYPFFGVKLPIIAAFLIIMYVLIFITKVLSEISILILKNSK